MWVKNKHLLSYATKILDLFQQLVYPDQYSIPYDLVNSDMEDSQLSSC